MQEVIPSKPALIVGRLLTGLTIAFLSFDTVMKLIRHVESIKATTGLGWSADSVVTIGIIEVICLVLYVFPRTAVLGAVLLTGYLGGALATNMRAGVPLFNLLFPFIIGSMMWGGIYLRERRLRTLLPIRGQINNS